MELSSSTAANRMRAIQYRRGGRNMSRSVTGQLRSILIVDDDEAVIQTFARMLSLEGYDVRTAMNAESGLREATAHHPDAIILDLRMPLMDGLGFLRRLRVIDQQRDIPVAIVTGDYFMDDQVSTELKSLGAEVKFKPLWLEDLVQLARELLNSKVLN